jgi:uncharacterized coiled-coil protein SlyX
VGEERRAHLRRVVRAHEPARVVEAGTGGTLARVPNDAQLEARIVDLELRFMRTEKLLDDLNEVVVGQRREIDRLVGEVKSLREQMMAGPGEEAKNERPPHY